MHGEAKVNSHDAAFTSASIAQIAFSKKAALRHGVWFRALSRVERGILDLTTRYVVRIRSPTLANVVTAILKS